MAIEANVIRLNVPPPDPQAAPGRPPIALASVRNEIAGHLRQLLQALFERADDWLFEIADHAGDAHEQHALFEAMRNLRTSRPVIERSFQQRVFAAFASIDADDAQSPGLRRLAATQPLQAEQAHEPRENAALDAMGARLAPRVADSLGQLTLRIGALTRRRLIEGRNPFGPDALCGYFLDACQCLGVETPIRLLMLRLFERYVAADLDRLYRQSNQTLAAAGVLPGLQPDRQRSHSCTPGPIPADDPADGLLALLAKLLARREQRLQAQRRAAAPGAGADSVAPLMALLFERLLCDGNLPIPLRRLLHRLQPAFTQLARRDEALLEQRDHPARRLLDEMALAAMGWNHHDDLAADPVYRVIEQITRRLAATPIEDSAPFRESLRSLRVVCGEERRRSELLTQRTLATEEQHLRAAQARQRVEAALNARLLGRPLPDAVLRLLCEGWSQVLLHACLHQGAHSSQWQAALRTMDRLLWSVSLERSPQAQGQLLEALPLLLADLQRGLASVAFDPFATASFFTQLETIHLQVAAQSVPATRLGLRVLDGPVRLAWPSGAEHDNAAAEREPSPPDRSLAQLRPGCWLEFREDERHRLRCRLATRTQPGDLYLFVNRAGIKVLEKTAGAIACDLQRGALHLLDEGSAFDRAFEALLAELQRFA